MRFYGYSQYGIIACAVILLVGAEPTIASEPNAAQSNTPAEYGLEAAPLASDVAVTVNGVDITESQLEEFIKPQLERMATDPGKVHPLMLEQFKRQLRQQALDKLIVDQLLEEQAEASNIVVTEADVIKHLRESGAQQQPPLSLEDIQALVEAQGQSFDEMKKQIQNSNGMKYQKLLDTQFAGKVDVNEVDVVRFYVENKSRFEILEQVRASHILITPETSDPNTDPNVAKAKAKAKAEELLGQIKASGADFATLAKANSQCPTAASGGDLGFFPRGKMAPPFEKAAFELKVGQVSDVVETRYGYHIIRVTDRKEARVIKFEEARSEIIGRLTQQKQREIATEYIESLKQKAKIVYPAGKEPPAAPPAMSPSMIRPK
jgi:peptidyl-prolyl cis-trans isomerase C